MKPPAFQFYASDFLVGTATMSAEAVGAYIRLLCYQWDMGSIPDNDDAICRLGGCGGIAVAQVRLKFASKNGTLRNPRMEQEREKQRVYREKQAENGAKRWAGNAKPHAVAMPTHVPNGCSPSPSPSPSPDSVSGSAAPVAKPPRPRNTLIDALATIEGIPLDQISQPVGARMAKALSVIKQTAPAVEPAEINRRAENLRRHHQGAPCTAMALANNWGKCDQPPAAGTVPGERKNWLGR